MKLSMTKFAEWAHAVDCCSNQLLLVWLPTCLGISCFWALCAPPRKNGGLHCFCLRTQMTPTLLVYLVRKVWVDTVSLYPTIECWSNIPSYSNSIVDIRLRPRVGAAPGEPVFSKRRGVKSVLPPDDLFWVYALFASPMSDHCVQIDVIHKTGSA